MRTLAQFHMFVGSKVLGVIDVWKRTNRDAAGLDLAAVLCGFQLRVIQSHRRAFEAVVSFLVRQ